MVDKAGPLYHPTIDAQFDTIICDGPIKLGMLMPILIKVASSLLNLQATIFLRSLPLKKCFDAGRDESCQTTYSTIFSVSPCIHRAKRQLLCLRQHKPTPTTFIACYNPNGDLR